MPVFVLAGDGNGCSPGREVVGKFARCPDAGRSGASKLPRRHFTDKFSTIDPTRLSSGSVPAL